MILLSDSKKKDVVKRQHYVPQFYLKRFSDNKGDSFHITYFDKIRNVTDSSNIKSIAKSNKYYDVTVEKLAEYDYDIPEEMWDPQQLEQYFSLLESDWALVIAQLQQTFEENNFALEEFIKNFNLNTEQFFKISHFLALQAVRTPAWKNQAAILQSTLANVDDDLLKRISEVNYDEFAFYIHINEGVIERLSEFLRNNFDWSFGFSEDPLVTSDNPLCRVFHVLNNMQLTSVNELPLPPFFEEYSIALTPNILLILNQKNPIFVPDKVTTTNFIVSPLLHRRYARLQIVNSIRNVFHIKSQTKRIKAYIKRMDQVGVKFRTSPPPFLFSIPDKKYDI